MKTAIKLFFMAIALCVVHACKKDEKTPQQLLEGKWILESQEILGSSVQGDGSYLVFNACSSSCSGEDYKASDATNGTFTYTINEEGTMLTITDNSGDGGSWGASWDILDLSESNLRITTSTILGNTTADFKR